MDVYDHGIVPLSGFGVLAVVGRLILFSALKASKRHNHHPKIVNQCTGLPYIRMSCDRKLSNRCSFMRNELYIIFNSTEYTKFQHTFKLKFKMKKKRK